MQPIGVICRTSEHFQRERDVGYKLTSLANLPFDDAVDMYIFSIGDDLWDGTLQDIVTKHFDNIARAIGKNAVIVGGLQDECHGDVVQQYLGTHYAALKNLMPAVLITDCHPDKLTAESMRLLIPLREANRRYDFIDDFLSDLASFVRCENDRLLVALENAPRPGKGADDIVKVNFPIVPGIVAVNLNGAARHLREWWIRHCRAR